MNIFIKWGFKIIRGSTGKGGENVSNTMTKKEVLKKAHEAIATKYERIFSRILKDVKDDYDKIISKLVSA